MWKRRIKQNSKSQKISNNSSPLNEVDKSTLSVLMRRLIEIMINKYVFNEQRTQYKRDKINCAI